VEKELIDALNRLAENTNQSNLAINNLASHVKAFVDVERWKCEMVDDRIAELAELGMPRHEIARELELSLRHVNEVLQTEASKYESGYRRTYLENARHDSHPS
jgi:predicted transcriptional regulator